MLDLSLREARRIALGAQGLAGPPPKRPTKALMREAIRRLGVVQIDTINVVARSHHIVLWSRLGNHPPEWLDELLRERALFEYWAHAAAYVPIELFSCFRPMMTRQLDVDGAGWKPKGRDWLSQNRAVLEQVIEHVRENGAVSARSFEAPAGTPRAAAWSWFGNKPTNVALEILWTAGVLMVERRDGFQRWYNLTERVYPGWDHDDPLSADDQRRVLGEHALRAMGLTTARWLPDYFRSNWERWIKPRESKPLLEDMTERGLAVRARVEGIDEDVYVWSEQLNRRIPMSRTTLLSPFDSLIWDRRRTQGLFQFEVTLECYIPAPKRRYGYFSLPILYRDRLVGRLDPKAERKQRVLVVKALHLEPWFQTKADEHFYAGLARTLEDFAAFNGSDSVVVEDGGQVDSAALLRHAVLSLGTGGPRRSINRHTSG
jgi:uncharacterized protein YcaQ